jgi:hypothetical protein
MNNTELNSYSLDQLRTLYALIRAIVCDSEEDLKEFNADMEYYTKQWRGNGNTDPVNYCLLALSDLKATYYSRKDFEPAPGCSEFEKPNPIFIEDSEGYQAALEGLRAAITA